MTLPTSPRAALWRIDRADRPFFGYGTVVDPQLVLLHPSDRGWTPRSGRLRARIVSPDGTDVIDGTLLAGDVRGLVTTRMVRLDGPIVPTVIDSIHWPRHGDTDSRTEFLATLADLAAADPTGDPGPAPEEADPPRDPFNDFPGLVPPWCWLFPGCPGCR